MGALRRARGWVLVVVIVVIATACLPSFPNQAALTVKPVSATSVNLIWNAAVDSDPGDGISYYAIYVNNTYSAYVYGPATNCTLVGLAPGTNYTFLVTAVSLNNEWSGNIGGDFVSLGRLSANYTTPAGSPSGATLSCADTSGGLDRDNDRLPDWAESNTGTFVNPANTGTNPMMFDTDGDGIGDGDETLGTAAGLLLPGMGAKPLRKNMFIEADWFDSTERCGYSYSQRPTDAQATRVRNAFASSPVSNPDGSTGIDLMIDYGQGGNAFGGNLIAGNGLITGEVNDPNDASFDTMKAANFTATRNGYFHYMLMAVQYGGGNSSGVAELPGDDFIVSLPPCLFLSGSRGHSDDIANTIMHELGHNLNQRHGGANHVNDKPNYNSIMNYRYQGSGIDTNCDSVGDGALDFSRGTRLSLNEAALNELTGVCGTGFPIDWNHNGVLSTSVAVDLNGSGAYDSYSDYNNWANIYYGGVSEADGSAVEPPWIVEQDAIPG